ncbi:hypothetical protein [Streptomyces nitrosporeus]|uniref:hypothetical protein n=1 Tax=Streptomyces nitrosporeus TaxID=28894 RepID=UPI00399F4234
MAFPESALGLRVELLLGGMWRDVTRDVYTREPIQITHGTSAEGAQPDPASCSLLLNNVDGRYSPRNPAGPYFGMLGRNTPIRIVVPGAESYLNLLGDVGSYARTPDAAPLRITGDLDIRVEAEADWYATPVQTLIGKWVSAAGQRGYVLRTADGLVALNWSTDGAQNFFAQQQLPALPRRAALRATLDSDNGAGGFTARMYWATSLDGPWTEIGDPLVVAGTTTIYPGTAPLEVAPVGINGWGPARARVYRAEVRSDIGGTVVAAPDFRGRADDTTSLTDSAGRTWEVSAGAEITSREHLFSGEVSEWPPRWSAGEKSAWVPIQAAGILRRLSQGRRPLQSTLRRRIPTGPGLLAYWPMEDGSTASQLYSPTPGARPLTVSGMNLAADSSLPGSAPLPTLEATASLTATVPATSAAGWHVEMVYRLPSLPAIRTEILRLSVAGMGSISTVHAFASTAGIRIEARNAEGEQVAAYELGDPAGINVFAGPWNRLSIFASPRAADTTISMAWRDVITGRRWYAATAAVVPLGRVTAVRGTWGSATQGMALGHLAAFSVPGTATSTAEVTIYDGADRGYLRETATARLARLAAEEPTLALTTVIGDRTIPAAEMGPQGQDTLLDLVAECAASDGGVLYERMDRPGLVYRDRATLYTQAPALTLDYAAGQVAPPLEPTDDDTSMANDVTVTRAGGSSGRHVVEDGPNSVRPPENGGIGLYEQAVTLSLGTDAQTAPLAGWLAHLGTWDEARYPQVRVHLHRHPELIPAALRLRPGDVLRITNPPVYTGPGPLDLIVRQIQHEPRPRAWNMTMVCTPAGPYRVGVVGDPVLGRADTDGSQLGGPVDEAATVLPVTVTAGPRWVTGAPNLQPNSGFETGTGLWGCSRGDSIGTVSPERTIVHSGTAAIRLTRVHPTDTGTMNLAERWVFYPAGPGQTWTGRVWVYSGGAATNAMRLALVWQTAGGDVFAYGTAVPTGPGYWQELTVTATAPAGTTGVRLSPEGRSAWTVGEWWIADDLRLARLDDLADDDQPDEFPFAVALGGEQVTVLGISGAAGDGFERVSASGWGTTPGGQAWIETGGTTGDRAVSGGAGTLTISAPVTAWRIQRLGLTLADCEITAVVSVSQMAVGGALSPCILLRHVSDTDFYVVRPYFYPDGLLYLSFYTNAEGTIGGFPSSGYSYTPGQQFTVRARIDGQRVRARVWPTASREPEGQWHLDATATTAVNPSGDVGILGFCESGSTNVSPVLSVHDFRVINPQRMHVARGVNGITKSHGTGTDVRLAQPAIVAL